jgi:hypothetical protein
MRWCRKTYKLTFPANVTEGQASACDRDKGVTSPHVIKDRESDDIHLIFLIGSIHAILNVILIPVLPMKQDMSMVGGSWMVGNHPCHLISIQLIPLSLQRRSLYAMSFISIMSNQLIHL